MPRFAKDEIDFIRSFGGSQKVSIPVMRTPFHSASIGRRIRSLHSGNERIQKHKSCCCKCMDSGGQLHSVENKQVECGCRGVRCVTMLTAVLSVVQCGTVRAADRKEDINICIDASILAANDWSLAYRLLFLCMHSQAQCRIRPLIDWDCLVTVRTP